MADVYIRLILLTAGTLLSFLWIAVILGHRRQRSFERIFFFLCLALVFLFGGALLELNGQLYYSKLPKHFDQFSWTVVCLGLWMLPSLLLHLQVDYAHVRGLFRSRLQKGLWTLAAYAPAALLSPSLLTALGMQAPPDLVFPSNSLGRIFQAWMAVAFVVAAGWQRKFQRVAPDKEQKAFHRRLKWTFFFLACWVVVVHAVFWISPGQEQRPAIFLLLLLCASLDPLVSLLRNVEKFNFLQIGRQRNLIYAVLATFLALLYLSFIRRVGLWLEPYLPPESTAALLLFLPVLFFEPLQRFVGRILRRTAQKEMDEAHRMMGPIQEVARLGNLGKLVAFVQTWIGDRLQMEEVELLLDADERTKEPRKSGQRFPIRHSSRLIGMLRVKPYGAMLSGETQAALEFLCEQLPGALDLCRLIEEKLRLERELAERERLAVLGQMAASISHNLKNPLGSIKTILQVQLESPEMPESMRAETRMVLEEISRLSGKLNQLLQFSRPAVRGGEVAPTCDPRMVADEVGGVLRHEAERRGVTLEVEVRADGAKLAASAEAVSEILSNLVVNALDATPRGGHVTISGATNGEGYLLAVQDDGPGVAEQIREKILQPFFTTKTQGTGLGLAIVARRVAEFAGKLECKSPVKNEKGARFEVTLPLEGTRK